ncbi:MAG: phenylacetate-CoA oxygenase subunit PaaJ [Phycisphaerae bacterium]|nr:phenylacetate-CoA oxygenase subunit PaaJ [Phycisphaerae bacterium]NUQ45094.1 phenylacetate-CoA oxygenase subunit PaaJ [Phycisphaerae bacterium]
MICVDAVRDVLATINDPEMPISIVDLGIIDGVAAREHEVTIRLLPTFVGCPALEMIRHEIETKVARVPGVKSVDVEVVFDPPWTPDRISEQGRENLRQFGVTTPGPHGPRGPVLVQVGVEGKLACPFCGADAARLESPFGPTRCRMIYYCEACKNQFEHMKRV